MARTFDATTEDLSSTSTSTAPGSVGTIAFWIKPAWNSGDGTARFFCKVQLSTTPNNRELAILRWSANTINAGWNDFTASDFDELSVSDAGIFTSGTWTHLAMTWSDPANTIELFASGSSIGTRTSGLVTYSAGTGYKHSVGNSSSGGADCRGDMCEYGLWSSILNAENISALSKGASPLLVAPSTLEVYLPMVGNASPETNQLGPAFTVTGATKADHPRIVYPF